MTKPNPKHVIDAAVAALNLHNVTERRAIDRAQAKLWEEWDAYIEGVAREKHPIVSGLDRSGYLERFHSDDEGDVDVKWFEVHFKRRGVTVSVTVSVSRSVMGRWNRRLLKLEERRRRTRDVRASYLRDLFDRHPDVAEKVVKLINGAILSEVP